MFVSDERTLTFAVRNSISTSTSKEDNSSTKTNKQQSKTASQLNGIAIQGKTGTTSPKPISLLAIAVDSHVTVRQSRAY